MGGTIFNDTLRIQTGAGAGTTVGFCVSFIKSPKDTVSGSTGDVFAAAVGAAVGGTIVLTD